MQHLPLLSQHRIVDRLLNQHMPETVGGPPRHPYPRQESRLAKSIGSVRKRALAEIGQQGRVDVDHPAAKAVDHACRHQLQVPGQHDEVRVMQRGQQLGGVVGVTEHGGRHGGAARAIERAGLGPARDHAGDARQGRPV